MTIHHLNCATMRPRAAKLLRGTGGLFEATPMVTHCLLLEGRRGLVLVDTGLGTEDVADPLGRLGRAFVFAARPALDPTETALRQVEALGYAAGDVRHIVVTHLDVDHAGGLGDFPDAQVHIQRAELDAARKHRTFVDRHRYRSAQWAHGPRWLEHDEGTERWCGLEGCRPIGSVEPEVWLVPLPGHSAGHSGVAVRAGAGWVLFCGDAYFDRRELTQPTTTPLGLFLFQRALVVDEGLRKRQQSRLRRLLTERDDVEVFCAHDPSELPKS